MTTADPITPPLDGMPEPPPPVRYVLGIDPSLTKTGVGVVYDDGRVDGQLVKHLRPLEKAKRIKQGLPEKPNLTERRQCIETGGRQVGEAMPWVGRCVLAVVYDPPAGAGALGPARLDMPGMWWELVGMLVDAQVPVARLLDVSARKAITGSGKNEGREAAKVATALAVRKLYPDVEIASDDVADALAAAHLGAVALGWPVPTLERHRAVKWSEWPATAVGVS